MVFATSKGRTADQNWRQKYKKIGLRERNKSTFGNKLNTKTTEEGKEDFKASK